MASPLRLPLEPQPVSYLRDQGGPKSATRHLQDSGALESKLRARNSHKQLIFT